MRRDLRTLPQLKDSISFLYVEHCIIEQSGNSIIKIDENGKTPIPIAIICTLLLGPGVSITHDAVKAIADCGCMAVWCGEHGLVFYAFGKGDTRSGKNLLHQVNVYSNPDKHLNCVRRMYYRRFPKMPSENLTLEQLRGLEGVRVKTAYSDASRKYGIKWSGRKYSETDWNESDPINKALSLANSMLYSVCYSAILSLGYSPGIGFIHTGKSEAFVYDIADLYKADSTIPLAFEAVAQTNYPLEMAVRRGARDYFHRIHLLKRLPQDISYVLDVDEDNDVDGSKGLWNGNNQEIAGGINYGGGRRAE